MVYADGQHDRRTAYTVEFIYTDGSASTSLTILAKDSATPADPGTTTTTPGDTTNPTIPQTGDNSNIWLWIGLMAACLAGFILLLLLGRNRKGKKNAYMPRH